MNWEAVEAISSLVATVGVIVTLVYLATQLRESNKLARAQSLQNVLIGYTERQLSILMSEPGLRDVVQRGLHNWGEMCTDDQLLFHTWLSSEILHMQNVVQLRERGLIDEIDYEAWLTYIASIVKTPGGMECWGNIRIGLTASMVDVIETFIDSHPDAPDLFDLEPFRRT